MTKSPTPTESTKKRKARRAQKDTKLVDYTAVANRHKKVSWSNNSRKTGMVNRFTGPTFSIPTKAVESKGPNNVIRKMITF